MTNENQDHAETVANDRLPLEVSNAIVVVIVRVKPSMLPRQ